MHQLLERQAISTVIAATSVVISLLLSPEAKGKVVSELVVAERHTSCHVWEA